MKSTIFASFADPQEAERAAGALLDHGLSASNITILTHEEYANERSASIAANANPNERQSIENEIEANETTGTSVGFSAVNDFGRSMNAPEDSISMPGSKIAYGAEMAGAIESTDAATDYRGGDAAFKRDPAVTGEPIANYSSQAVVDDMRRSELTAASGVTVTTPADVGSGALKGTAVGIGVGILATLAAVFIPGVGFVMGSGALALALAGTAGSAGAGAIAGGFVGLMKDQGVPDGAVVVYREAIDAGGAILAVNIPVDANRGELEAVLAKYGADNLDLYGPYPEAAEVNS